MNEIYNISNVFFLPSYQELFPMTILEAFNCKLPVLLRDLDVYPKVFLDYYLKGTDHQGFIQEISRLQGDPEYHTYWSNQSWKGHEYYSEAHVLSMWKDFYSKCFHQELLCEEKHI